MSIRPYTPYTFEYTAVYPEWVGKYTAVYLRYMAVFWEYTAVYRKYTAVYARYTVVLHGHGTVWVRGMHTRLAHVTPLVQTLKHANMFVGQ